MRILFTLLTLLVVSPVVGLADEPTPPNFLIILADDCTYNDLPLYGGLNANTPHIDQFAAEGLTFNRAYLAEAMCQPCRAELYTGQFPMRNGCAWNHSASRPDAKSMPQHLGKLGYRVGITGKVHVRPEKAFPFEDVPGFDPKAGRDPTRPHDVTGIRKFMERDDDEPFCLVVALAEPHVPWVMGDASKYPRDKLKLPPNLADTPETRRDFSAYLAEVSYMDGQVGDILKILDDVGKRNSTLVLFTSEQGSQFPGNKWTCWDTGVHTALVARWPNKIAADKRTDAIVHFADVLPTFLELAGQTEPLASLDGRSFAHVLSAPSKPHRKFAYAIQNQVPEGPSYPVRGVSDGRYRYIRNLAPEELFIEKHLMGLIGGSAKHNAYWPSWPREAVENEHTYMLVRRWMRRPAEQLYNTANDPYEMNNLAEDAQFAEIKQRLSEELDRWMAEQGDPGRPVDTVKAHAAAKRGKHLYGPNDAE